MGGGVRPQRYNIRTVCSIPCVQYTIGRLALFALANECSRRGLCFFSHRRFISQRCQFTIVSPDSAVRGQTQSARAAAHTARPAPEPRAPGGDAALTQAGAFLTMLYSIEHAAFEHKDQIDSMPPDEEVLKLEKKQESFVIAWREASSWRRTAGC